MTINELHDDMMAKFKSLGTNVWRVVGVSLTIGMILGGIFKSQINANTIKIAQVEKQQYQQTIDINYALQDIKYVRDMLARMEALNEKSFKSIESNNKIAFDRLENKLNALRELK